MSKPISKSVLTEPQARLVELLQRLNFGRIEDLQVRGGEPVLDPPPRVVRKLKMGADNAPRPEADLREFWLKRPIIEMLQTITAIGDGVVNSIDVKYGLPFALEVEERPERCRDRASER